MADFSQKPILALETSTEICSVALWRDGVVSERVLPSGGGHSERVLPFVAELLSELKLQLHDLAAVAYGEGPGAFTGLRLACGVAQGLAFGAGLPVIGVGSLEALAWAASRATGHLLIYPVVDARMNEVYFAAYQCQGGVCAEVLAPGVAAASDVILPQGAGWFGCGSGFAAYETALSWRLAENLAGFDAAMQPSAAAVATLAAARLSRGEEGGDPFSAQPAYVRQKVALTTAERLARGGKA